MREKIKIEIQEEVKQLDHLASEGPTDSITKELLRTQEVLNQKNEQIFLKLRQQQFAFGEKKMANTWQAK